MSLTKLSLIPALSAALVLLSGCCGTVCPFGGSKENARTEVPAKKAETSATRAPEKKAEVAKPATTTPVKKVEATKPAAPAPVPAPANKVEATKPATAAPAPVKKVEATKPAAPAKKAETVAPKAVATTPKAPEKKVETPVAPLKNMTWTLATDKASSVYKCGENATFLLGAKSDNQYVKTGRCTVRLTLDGGKVLATREVDFSKENPAKITATLKEPGFIRFTVGGASKHIAPTRYPSIGAGFDPQHIKPSVKCPGDFMTFWLDGMKKLEKTPLDLKLEKLPQFSTRNYTGYAISVAGPYGTRASGYLSVPTKPGKYPARILVPGAGPGVIRPESSPDMITLSMNVHRYVTIPGDAKATKELYDQYNKTYGTYSIQNSNDREKYFFHAAYLGIMRAVKYIQTRPEWDGKNLQVHGSSQGGASAIILAALEPRMTVAASNVPALADHFGHRKAHQDGWPKMVLNSEWMAKNEAAKQKLGAVATQKYIAERRAATEATAPYFDVVNFAQYVKCPMIVGVGFIDATCPPTGIYAAYNQIKSPKRIINSPDMAHSQSKEFTEAKNEWLKKYTVK